MLVFFFFLFLTVFPVTYGGEKNVSFYWRWVGVRAKLTFVSFFFFLFMNPKWRSKHEVKMRKYDNLQKKMARGCKMTKMEWMWKIRRWMSGCRRWEFEGVDVENEGVKRGGSQSYNKREECVLRRPIHPPAISLANCIHRTDPLLILRLADLLTLT